MPSPTGIYTYGPALSLHVALPISGGGHAAGIGLGVIAVDEGADGEFGRDTAALCASHSIGDGGHRAMAGKFASAGKVDARIILVRGTPAPLAGPAARNPKATAGPHSTILPRSRARVNVPALSSTHWIMS